MTYLEQLYALLKRFTQTQVAEAIGVTERTIQFWTTEENPKTPFPKARKKIGEIYAKCIIEGRPIDNLEDEQQENYTEERRAKSNKHIPFLVPFVPIKAQAGYVKAIDQEIFLDTLEKYSLPPGVNHHGYIWRYWEVEGDSMEPTFKDGDIVLTSFVHQMDWENLRNFYTYVIVTEERILIKRIFCKNQLEWVLISDNEEMYGQRLLPVDSIKEVWVYRKTWSTRAAPPKEFKIVV